MNTTNWLYAGRVAGVALLAVAVLITVMSLVASLFAPVIAVFHVLGR